MKDLETGHVSIGFKVPGELAAKADAAAKAEGITRSDIARRALMRDLAGMFGQAPQQPLGEAA
jgi:hypothetical protein